ncbi:MAG: hypothetical protein LBS93_01660 [Synergistaceae bacterium]|jgi:signal transduction histidine kinase|nr:hypothetical protein [Synergistaceae bacterium]
MKKIFRARAVLISNANEHTKDGEVGGMGLSICRDIVTSHGGKIWMESGIFVGTTAFFTLPAKGGVRV